MKEIKLQRAPIMSTEAILAMLNDRLNGNERYSVSYLTRAEIEKIWPEEKK